MTPAEIYTATSWKKTTLVILIIDETKVEEAALQGVNEN
jgi:hypothetical protein